MIQDHSDHGASKELIDESVTRLDSSVPSMMYHNLSDPGSLILTLITLKESSAV